MKILLLSIDQELAQLRKAVLEAKGHEVMVLSSEKEALKAAQSPSRYDAVLLCHSFPAAAARRTVRLFSHGHPDTRIVYIARVYGEWPEIEADRYVVGSDGPAALVR